MSDDAEPSGRGRGRRPADEVRTDVLRAVGTVLLTEGIADLSFDRVAKLSGVSRTTLHKWWPSKGALALDGFLHTVEDTLAFADTGDIRADLISQLRAFVRLTTETPGGRVLTQLIGQAQTDPELLTAFMSRYSRHRRARALDRLLRAQNQGQIRTDVDVRVVMDQLWGAVYNRLLVPDEPVDDQFVLALVGNILGGIT